MARAKVNLEDVQNVSKAIGAAESSAISSVEEVEDSVSNNISTLELTSRKLDEVLSACNNAMARLKALREKAQTALVSVRSELSITPPKIQSTETDRDGKPVTVAEDNPRYLELLEKELGLQAKIDGYDQLTDRFNALARDCTKQKETVQAAKSSLDSISVELKSVKEKYESHCEAAIERLSNISDMVSSYMSIHIEGVDNSGSSSSSSGRLSKFGTFVSKKVFKPVSKAVSTAAGIGSIAAAVVAPVTAGPSTQIDQVMATVDEYYEWDVKRRKAENDREQEIELTERNTPKNSTPVDPPEEFSFTTTKDGKVVKYIASIDVQGTVEGDTQIPTWSVEALENTNAVLDGTPETSNGSDPAQLSGESVEKLQSNNEDKQIPSTEQIEQEAPQKNDSTNRVSFLKKAGIFTGLGASLAAQPQIYKESILETTQHTEQWNNQNDKSISTEEEVRKLSTAIYYATKEAFEDIEKREKADREWEQSIKDQNTPKSSGPLPPRKDEWEYTVTQNGETIKIIAAFSNEGDETDPIVISKDESDE